MADLRVLFSGFHLQNVQTYIQSGNVIFDHPEGNAAELESAIERQLAEALGYPVAIILRSFDELAKIAATPFINRPLDGTITRYVTFLKTAPPAALGEQVMALSNDVDQLFLGGRELYALCFRDRGKSNFSNQLLEKQLGMPGTTRNLNTVRKILEKYRDDSA